MGNFPETTGRVDDWDVIVIGHLRVNTYFGETYGAPPRGDPSTCTSVMVRGRAPDGAPYILVIDPTIRASARDYDFDINRRTGLHLSDVTHCFCTHHHADHYEALSYFPDAAWYAGPEAAVLIQDNVNGKITGVKGEFLPGVRAVPLPGHTRSLYGAAFTHDGKRVLAAGDAVMSKYHFIHETTDFQNDPELIQEAARSIRDMKRLYDMVVPGHDNIIVI